ELNATVKAYAALKLAGLPVESEPLTRARECVLRLGGIQETNSYVRINLSLFGLYPRRHVPTIPPELVLLPGGLIYEMSSWTRAIVVPLSIVQARAGRRPVPAGFDLDELAAPRVFRPTRPRPEGREKGRGGDYSQGGAAGGGEVDARPPPPQRRARRH